MTGAVKAIEKFFPGMSRHNDVQDALRKYNESVNEAKDPDIIAKLRDIVKNKQNKVIKDPKSGRKMRVDGYSASAIVQVYDALNTSNKNKFSKLGLLKMQSVAFKFVK